jgi:hypothetical protein
MTHVVGFAVATTVLALKPRAGQRQAGFEAAQSWRPALRAHGLRLVV